MAEKFNIYYEPVSHRFSTLPGEMRVLHEKDGLQGTFYEQMIAGKPLSFTYMSKERPEHTAEGLVKSRGVAVIEIHEARDSEVKVNRMFEDSVREATPDETVLFARGIAFAVADLQRSNGEAKYPGSAKSHSQVARDASRLGRVYINRMAQGLNERGYVSHAERVSELQI